MSTHIGDAWRAAGLLPIAMVVQCTGSIAQGPGRISDFCHGLLSLGWRWRFYLGCSYGGRSPGAFGQVEHEAVGPGGQEAAARLKHDAPPGSDHRLRQRPGGQEAAGGLFVMRDVPAAKRPPPD